MPTADDLAARLGSVLIPVMIVATGCAVSLLPHVVVINVLSLLGAWLLLSLPIGVVAGHCMLE